MDLPAKVDSCNILAAKGAARMGVVVTVMNMKGGVGKTTVAMHIAGRMG